MSTIVFCPVCDMYRQIKSTVPYTVKRCRPCAARAIAAEHADLLRSYSIERESYVDEVAVQRMISRDQPPASHTRAERQAAIAALMARGWGCRRIAAWLEINERTVQRLRKRILSGVDTLQLTG